MYYGVEISVTTSAVSEIQTTVLRADYTYNRIRTCTGGTLTKRYQEKRDSFLGYEVPASFNSRSFQFCFGPKAGPSAIFQFSHFLTFSQLVVNRGVWNHVSRMF